MDEKLLTDEHIAEGNEDPTLGPAYFAAREIVSRFMKSFEAEQFKPLVKSFVEKFSDELWERIDDYLLSDTESNLQSYVWRMVDEIVEEILSGARPWIAQKYALRGRYDCLKVRAALAKTIAPELQDARIADLEDQVADLKKELEFHRRP